jgi:glycosyltransferase involved in cell wall biosynthesis
MTVGASLPLKISVVIPVHNGGQTLGKCLEALHRSNYPPYEIIVVDDCSTDDSFDVASRFSCRVSKLEERQGAAKAKNRGATRATGDVVFFTDADVLVEEDTLSLIADDLANPRISGVVGLLSTELGYSNFSSQYKNLWMHYTYARLPCYVGVFYTSAAAIRTAVFRQTTGFDENYRGASVTEDTEFGQRLLTAGHKIYLDKRLAVKHLKYYSLADIVRTDFRRSYGLTKTMLRNWFGGSKQVCYTSVPWFSVLGVPLSFLGVLSVLLGLSRKDPRFLIGAVICFAITLLLNAPLLSFFGKKRGPFFLGQCCGFLLLDMLVADLGVMSAVAGFMVGKRY